MIAQCCVRTKQSQARCGGVPCTDVLKHLRVSCYSCKATVHQTQQAWCVVSMLCVHVFQVFAQVAQVECTSVRTVGHWNNYGLDVQTQESQTHILHTDTQM